MLMKLRLAEGFYDQADLGGCEGTAARGVAVGSETFVESATGTQSNRYRVRRMVYLYSGNIATEPLKLYLP